MMEKDTEMEPSTAGDAEFNTIDWRSVPLLSRRVGQRYGFAAVPITRRDVALLGGAVHFEFSSSQTASTKGDVERGNPVPFSQVHCIDSDFACTLLTISSAKELPCPRLYHSAARLGSGIVVFGGQAFNDKRKLADIWYLDIHHADDRSGVWRELDPVSRTTALPPPRSKHATTVCGNSLILFGGSGFEEAVFGDMWVAQLESNMSVYWKRVNSPAGRVPPARKLHALSPMVSDMELIMHGGVDSNGVQLSDMWIAQFLNEDKTRCVWTELVRAPHPRSGHIIFPAFLPEEPKGNRCLMVLGGNHPSAARYNVDSGEWSTCRFQQGVGHSFVAVEMDTIYSLDSKDEDGNGTKEEERVEVPAILLVPDTVLRSNPSNPWLASIFPIDPQEDKKESDTKKVDETLSAASQLLDNVDLEVSAFQRKNAYRTWTSQLPSIPPSAVLAETGSTLMAMDEPKRSSDTLLSSVAQSPLFSLDYFVTNILSESPTIQVSSWNGGNISTCHMFVSGTHTHVSSEDTLKQFVNTEATVRAVADVANSCIIVVNTESGDKLIGFISETLNRHSLCGLYSSPVVSVNHSNHAEIHATLRLIMTYTPFKSADAVKELFSIFPSPGAGFLMIDYDGTSDTKSPSVGTHYKPVSMKDSVQFWTDALRSYLRPRPRAEQYALTFLDSVDVSINGQVPTVSLKSVLKTKLLQGGKEVFVGRFGTMTLGKLKGGENVGILIYSNGLLIRHLKGRFVAELDEPEDELEASPMKVTGIVDVGDKLTPVNGALSDFQEAISDSSEWIEFVSRIEEACLGYLSSN